MSELDPEDRYGIGGADYAINPEQLGVWRFDPNGSGSVVKEIAYDEEFGGFETGYDDVGMENYNNYSRTANRIGREEAD